MTDIIETIGDDIASAIETAQADADRAQQTADEIASAAMATELGRRIGEIERRFDEWQNNQADQSEATVAMVLGLTELRAQVDLLTQLQSPTPNPQSEGDGPRESPAPVEEIPVVVEPPVSQEPAPPAPPAPKKKRHSWI